MQALPTKEATQLKSIARKQPPLRVEDDLSDTVLIDNMLGNPRQRLSRLLRTAARQRLIPHGPNPGCFCQLESAVVVLTSTANTTALSIGVSREKNNENLFEAFFFSLDIDGKSNVDSTRFECMHDDIAKARDQGHGDPADAIGVDAFIHRVLKLQTLFGQGESLRRDELDQIAMYIGEYKPLHGVPIISFQSLLDFLCCSSISLASWNHTQQLQRRERRSILHSLRLRLTGVTSMTLEEALIADGIVDPSKLHTWLLKEFGHDMTEDEIHAILRDMAADHKAKAHGSNLPSDCCISLSGLEDFVLDGHIVENKRDRDTFRVIMDVQVRTTCPPSPPGLSYRRVSVKTRTRRSNNDARYFGGISTSMLPTSPVFIWYLRGTSCEDEEEFVFDEEEGRDVSCSTTRLPPIVDIRIEEERLSTDLVSAGYVYVGSLGRNNRYLWIRRAQNRAEARDCSLIDIALTAGEMRRLDDEMHFAPSCRGEQGWGEVGGRSKSSVPLVRSMRRVEDDDTDEVQDSIKGRDAKLWCRRNMHPSDRLSLYLKWSQGQKRRELDKSVKRGLRQLPLGVLSEGPHAVRLDCAVNLNRLFNERFSFGNMNLAAFNKLLVAAGLALNLEDSNLLFRRIAVVADSSARSDKGLSQSALVAFASRSDEEIDAIALHLKLELRRRFGISRHVPEDVKARQASSLADQLAHVARADRRGLGVHHLNFLIACSPELESEGNAHLTKQELWQLARALDPAFRGTISLTSLMNFICEDSREDSGHVDRILAAADVIRETVEGLLGRPKIGSLEQAASEVWKSYCDIHFRRLGLPLPPRYQTNLLMCLGDHGGAYRSVEIDAEDLCGVVERRLSPSDSSKLCFLLAPCNPSGRVSRKEFMDFFASDGPTGRADVDRMRRPQPIRPVVALIDDVSSELFLGPLLDVYKEWVLAAVAAGEAQKNGKERIGPEQFSVDCARKFSVVRDSALKSIVELLPESKHNRSDPTAKASDLVGVPWASFGNPRAQSEEKEDDVLHPPFRTINEVALLVLTCEAHNFEDEIDEGNSDSDQSDSDSEHHRSRRRERPVPPPPLIRPWNVTATTSIHGVHLIRLRTLLEGLCRAKHGAVPHVVLSDQHSSKPKSVVKEEKKVKKDLPSLPPLKFLIGDKEADKFMSSVVRQLAASQRDKKETTDGWLGGVNVGIQALAQAFNHPSVDPHPSRGKVSMRLFRKALRLCGVTMSQEEVEDSCELWLYESLVEYPRFLVLLRRAWVIEWMKDSGDDEVGELKEARLLLILLRSHFTTMCNMFTDGQDISKVFRKLYRAGSNEDGRLSCGSLLDCVRTGTEIAGEQQGQNEISWGGEEHNLPLAGGRARRIMRRLFDFFDDEGDGRVDPNEFHAILAHGEVGGSFVESTLRTTDKTWGAHSSDEEDDGDWLLTSLTKGNQSMHLQRFRTRSRLGKFTNAAVPDSIVSNPVIEKLSHTVSELWDEDRDSLRKYLARYVTEQGTISESRLLKFLSKAGLSESLSRKELTSALQCLDPTNSREVSHSLILKYIVDRGEKVKEDKEKKSKEKKKEESEVEIKLKARELERIMQHIFDVATEHETLSGTGKLRPAFKHFDPRGKGLVSRSTAADVLAFLGCSLIDEECDLVWDRLGRSDNLVDYEALDHVIASNASVLMERRQEHSRTLLNQTSPHVSFAAENTMTPSKMFQAPLTDIPKKNSYSVDPEDDVEVLMLLASQVLRAGAKEAAAWGKDFDFDRFVSVHCDHESIVKFETVTTVFQKLGLDIDPIATQVLHRRYGEPSGCIDISAFASFVAQYRGSDQLKKDSPVTKEVREHQHQHHQPGLSTILKLVGASLAGQQRLGLDIRMAFEMNEKIVGSGRIEVEGFVESLRQLDLRLGLEQLQCIIDAFAVRSEYGVEVDYHAFLEATSSITSPHAHSRNSRPSRFLTSRSDPPQPVLQLQPSPREISPRFNSPRVRRSDTTPSRQHHSHHPPEHRPTQVSSPSRHGVPSPAREAAVAIWGMGTPLQQRGKIPTHTQKKLHEAGKWMCLTCLYSENTPDFKTCLVCGAGNPTESDSFIQQECPGCHFMNGAFAKSCDMCQRSLSKHFVTPSHKKPTEESFGWRHANDSDED
mmetsp:Transcript_32352/g.37963  ORF Transcript_32352/g.37963 Transcript_32352/m.37963 type:complete len:2112 (+) Transcript_32352:48-6383(+)